MKKTQIYVIGAFALLIIWQLLLAFQGLDLADTGFHLTAYKYILSEPYSVQYSMSFWLSEIIGHFWVQLWPAGGLFWCRLGALAIFTSAFTIYYFLLKQELGSQESITALLIIATFILKGGFECLNYDILSMLGYALMILLLMSGLKKGNMLLIFLGGVTIGVNIFFKLTNLAGILFLLLIPFYFYIKEKNIRKFIMPGMIALAGIFAGSGAVLLLIKVAGHWELYFNNFSFMLQTANDVEASHGLLPLLKSYIIGFLNAFIILVLFMALCWGLCKLIKNSSVLSIKNIQLLIILFVALISIFLMLLFKDIFWSKVRYLLLGLAFLAGIQYSTDKTRSLGLRLLSMAGLILILAAPLGSDSWIGKSLHGMWILIPVLLADLDLKQLFRPLKVHFSRQLQQLIKYSLMSLIAISAIIFAWQNTYFDQGSRLLKRYSLQHENLKHIYTSKTRADVINDLCLNAFPMIEEEYLISFIEIPMVNYLSDKKPFLSTSWPKLYYSPEAFNMKLQEALEKRNELPAIIRQKQNTGVMNWPEAKADPSYLYYPKDMSKWPEHGNIMNTFISDHDYRIVWENEMFQLLLSKNVPNL